MAIKDYQYKTVPLVHQRKLLEETAELEAHALFHEMGCGKTKIIIDNIAYLYQQRKINGALIIAPNGVDINWQVDEIPIHLPDVVRKQSRIFRFTTKSAGTIWHQEQLKWQREHNGLAILLMSYDAILTDKGKDAAWQFLQKRTCLWALDESVSIKTPGAKRTMRITKAAHKAPYRRILDGYPTPKGAFDLYSQIKFLDPYFWARHGWESFVVFKQHFGVFQARYNSKTKTEYDEFLGYRNLDELAKLIEPISSRVLKQDVLDLPEKIYQPRYFDLSSQQRKLYNELENEYRLWLENDVLITANLAIVRLLRLQQISCGYLPVGEGEPEFIIEGKNPRLELLESLIENYNEKAIIWARYHLDINLIKDMMSTHNRNFVIHTGHQNDEEKLKARKDFQEGNAQYIIGTWASLHRGYTLHAAHQNFCYTNSFDLVHRKQGEDRSHRKGLDHGVIYTDLLANDTVDKNIMLNLCGKMDTAQKILGDEDLHDVRSQLKDWLHAK